MAEERVRRILSHAGRWRRMSCDENACSNSESEGIGGESTGPAPIGGVNAGQWRASSDGGLGEILPRMARQSSPPPPPPPPNPLEDRENSPGGAVEWPDFGEERANFGDSGLAKSIASSISSRSWGSSRQQQQQRDWPVADDCIFCKIIHGYAPAFKLYEDDFCVCILDINPLCYGHSLLVPKGHFPALDATPPPVAAAMCSVVPLLSNAIMGATSCDSFNMVVNNGQAAGQVVFHTHFHIVPRFSGDGLWTNESVVRKPLSTFRDPTQLTRAVRSILRNNEP